LTEATEVLAQAQPETLGALPEGYRDAVVASRDGGVAPRWVLSSSEPRQPQAQRTGDKPCRQHGDRAGPAFQPLCRTALACEAEAQQARASFAHDLQATCLHESPSGPTPQYGKRERPGPGAQPDQIVSPIVGALASRIAARPALGDQPRGCILATHELAEAQGPAPAVRAGDKGQAEAARGLRFLKAPQFLASARALQKPDRVMALGMVMTVCVLVYAA
jgi:hypothetical protein